MALSKPLISSLLLALVILYIVEADQMISNGGATQNIDCDGACADRCRLSSRQNLCNRACGTCCARCNCVPPGTSGNVEACPCYANMTTHGGRRKCP